MPEFGMFLECSCKVVNRLDFFRVACHAKEHGIAFGIVATVCAASELFRQRPIGLQECKLHFLLVRWIPHDTPGAPVLQHGAPGLCRPSLNGGLTCDSQCTALFLLLKEQPPLGRSVSSRTCAHQNSQLTPICTTEVSCPAVAMPSLRATPSSSRYA